VRQQDAFLVQGVQHLRPLNLRMVAEAIQMHESTVSRVTANKYMATPRGIFELKYFFSVLDCVLAMAARRIPRKPCVTASNRQLIDDEKPRTTFLSDDTIVDEAKRGRDRDCAPHGCEIPRGAAHPVVGAAPARKAFGSDLKLNKGE
jgi:RNA polymerase sigma-54 factor